MRKLVSTLAPVLLVVPTACSSPPRPHDASNERTSDGVARALDDLSRVAASGDVELYRSRFTPDARVLRAGVAVPLDGDEFHASMRENYARVADRSPARSEHRVTIASSGRIAWFDEVSSGEARGPRCVAGLMVFDPDAGWRVAHCELASERLGGVMANVLEDPATPTARTLVGSPVVHSR